MNRPILPYMDFSGGLNIETSNEKLKDNEMTVLQNADISTRGSVKRRTGRTKVDAIPGTGQGLFFFYRGQDQPDLIAAVSGQLYVKPYGSSTFSELIIYNADNTVFTFQDTLPIEAVQYRQTLFVATGTKLVEVTYDTVTSTHKASVMAPYKPTVLEVINIGSNAIADNPSTWIQEKTNPTVEIEGITASIPQGAVNTAVTFTAHVKKPVNVEVGYRFSWRPTGSGAYGPATATDNNYIDYTFQDVGGYDIKVDTTKKVYITDQFDTLLWTAAQPGISIQLSTGDLDAVPGSPSTKCLIMTNNGGTIDYTQPVVYRDYATPIDVSNSDKLSFYFSQWNYDGASTGTAQFNQLWLYTEGDLTTPVLKVDSTTYTGKVNGGPLWNLAQTAYDNSITGLDKIVRIGFKTGYVGTTYVPKTGANAPTYDVTQDTCTRIDDISMWMDGTEVSYTLVNFEIVGVIDPTVDPETYSAIHTSRSIRLHWDRLILAKDNKYPGQIYVSDLNNPRYFPTNKRIDFSLDRQEPITSIVRYQDFLVIFTKTTISTLTGKHPQDGDVTDGYEYRVSLINDTLGCIADRSAKVVANNIIFLSSDGLHSLVPNPYQLQNLEPQKIDFPVKSEIIHDAGACAIVHNEQYYLCFPSQSKVIRFYFNMNAWVKDVSSKLNIAQFAYYNGTVYNLTTNGTVYVQDDNVHADDGEIYDFIVQSKFIDLQSVFNYKKLKRLFVLAKYYEDHTVELYNRVWTDGQIVLDPTTGNMVIGNDGVVRWITTTAPNMHLYGSTELGFWTMGEGTFGEPSIFINESQIRGKCHRVRVSFTHSQDCESEILGFGFEFKYKSPGRMVNT